MQEKPQPATTQNAKELEKKIEMLIATIDRLYPSTKKLIWRSFLHGLFTGIGATIGLSLLVALITFLLHQARVIPLLEQMINAIQLEQVFPNQK